MLNNFIPLIILEILVTIAILYLLKYCDKRVIEFQKIIDREGKDIIESIKCLNKELIKLNLILEKLNEMRKTDWLKIITKTLDAINIILILAPLGKKIPFFKKLFSIKVIKRFLSLAR